MDGYHAFFGARSALLIGVEAGPELIAAAGAAVHELRGLTDLLAALTTNGLQRTPDFACVVHTQAETRLLVRGPFAASSLDAAGGPAHASGHDVSTWVELLLPARSDVELSVVGGPSVRVPAPLTDLSTCDIAAPTRTTALATATATVASARHDPPVPLPSPPQAGPPMTPTAAPETVPPATGTDSTVSGWSTSHGPVVPVAAAPSVDPFQHMFGHTEFFGAEAAAVRAVEAEETPPTPAVARAAAPPPGVVSPVPGTPPTSTPGGHALTGLIESVPFASGAARPVVTPPPVAPPTPTPTEAHTVSRAEMLRLAGATPVDAAIAAALPSGPQLQAVHCPVGHANNPTRETCRTCGAPITERAIVLVPRPILGKLRFTDGLVHAVHRPVLMGRQPTSDAWTGSEEPQLLALPDPEGMLSRTHAELRISDWQLQVVDRGSTNGTVVTLPGREPQKLREREPLLLGAGARVSLGGVVTFEFEESG